MSIERPVLNVKDIKDEITRRNFQNLRDFFIAQNQLLDFQFMELVFTTAGTKSQAHSLGYIPKDIILSKLTGTGPVVFNLGAFTATTLSVTASAACVVRFYYGTYQSGSNGTAPSDTQTFYPDSSIFQLAADPLVTPSELGFVKGASSNIQTQLDALSASGFVVGPVASVDSEIVLFSGATGKLVKRATGTGFVKVTSGVFSAVTPAFTDLSGNIAVSQMASGTGAGITTYFRGDGSWATAVSSVNITVPNIFTAGSAVTTSGNVSFTVANQNANLIWAGPSSGVRPHLLFDLSSWRIFHRVCLTSRAWAFLFLPRSTSLFLQSLAAELSRQSGTPFLPIRFSAAPLLEFQQHLPLGHS